MAFIDTQILSYKFKNNKEFFDGDIRGCQISSIVALEFLEIMIKGENKAKMYPVKLIGGWSYWPWLRHVAQNIKVPEIWKISADRVIIDFSGKYESILIYSNEAISDLINQKRSDMILLFARNALNKKEFKEFRKKLQFIVDNEITVVPVTTKTVAQMQCIYEDIKSEYNVKKNYRNSFMDLLILATAVEKKERLITEDKELNKALQKCCNYLDISSNSKGISNIDYRDDEKNQNIRKNHKNYVNNGWRIFLKNKKYRLFP